MRKPEFLTKHLGSSPSTTPPSLFDHGQTVWEPPRLTVSALGNLSSSRPINSNPNSSNSHIIESTSSSQKHKEVSSSIPNVPNSSDTNKTRKMSQRLLSKLNLSKRKIPRFLVDHFGFPSYLKRAEGDIVLKRNAPPIITPPRSLRSLFLPQANKDLFESASTRRARSQSSNEENESDIMQPTPRLSAGSMARLWSSREDNILSLMHELAGSIGDDNPGSQDFNESEGNSHFQTTQDRDGEKERLLKDNLALLRAESAASLSQSYARYDEDPDYLTPFTLSGSNSSNLNDVAENSVYEGPPIYKPNNAAIRIIKALLQIQKSSFLMRYMAYIGPVAAILLIPLLIGGFLYKTARIGGVELFWFSVWLEIVWISLWAGRILSTLTPWLVSLLCRLVTADGSKWNDLGRKLEVPVTLVLWTTALERSFLPIMANHVVPSYDGDTSWMTTFNRIIISLLVGTILNLLEKIGIRMLAISVHLRTRADRIEINEFQIDSLVKIYQYSKTKTGMKDFEFEDQRSTGARTEALAPMKYVLKAQKEATEAFQRAGDVAGKIARDFTSRRVTQSKHANRVVHALLESNAGCQVLARRMYRTFVDGDKGTVSFKDMKAAFENEEEADAAFKMLDRDLNGDLSLEELQYICVEIGKELKSILASLRDLDMVVSKLNGVLVLLVICATILVFVAMLSSSAMAFFIYAGSTALTLSWFFAATAQEFLQSLIFVLIKHPFDVGDRISIYGNTGTALNREDYFVKEMSLFFTKLKKMEGHIVQAPNNYLNTVLILNMRRSGGLSEAIPLAVKYGTSLEQIERLRLRMLGFVLMEKREYQDNVLTEMRDVVDVFSINFSLVFFYKSNWQNELLRLQRRNKFFCAMLTAIEDIGIEGPQMRLPGQKQSFPFYIHRPIGKIDYSLGTKGVTASDLVGDVHEKGPLQRLPEYARASTSHSHARTMPKEEESRSSLGHNLDNQQPWAESFMERGIPLR